MAKHIVKCRVCGKEFDAQEEGKNVSWVLPSNKCYYHKNCYDEWKAKSDVKAKNDDETYIDYIYDYLARDLKMPYDYFLCEAQRKNFMKKNHYTNKGIFFALKYFYDVQHGDCDKSNGGIGIVSYVYNDAIQYWTNMIEKQSNILEDIEAQMSKMSQIAPKRERVKQKSRKMKDRTAELLAEVENEYETR